MLLSVSFVVLWSGFYQLYLGLPVSYSVEFFLHELVYLTFDFSAKLELLMEIIVFWFVSLCFPSVSGDCSANTLSRSLAVVFLCFPLLALYHLFANYIHLLSS